MPALAEMGITCLWIPPACKAWEEGSTGYDTYDLYDLGEFNQQGRVPTKYGTKEELQRLVARASDCGVDILFDIVVNHKAAADYTEQVRGVRVKEFSMLGFHTRAYLPCLVATSYIAS